MGARVPLVLVAVSLLACGGENEPGLRFVAVTFNTGTTDGMGFGGPGDYGEEQAALSDEWYGNGLAWWSVIEDTREYLAELGPDVIGFQEIFHPGECEDIPVEAHAGFICETWEPGDPTVAQLILGAGYQVACHPETYDKCVGIRRVFGTLRGCDEDLCLDGLRGTRLQGCGSSARIGAGVIDLVDGGELTVVNIHGTSGFAERDRDCRVAQFAQVFEDLGLGDGRPAADGARNLVFGDLNTDPGRLAGTDPSAAYWSEHAGEGRRFRHLSDVGPDALPTYADVLNIDHVAADELRGSCWAAGITPDRPPVTATVYYDHVPIVCDVEGD
jgi:endonuclease/exonuclease/phosphatase family metal-dependent hydrolase